MVIKLIGKVEVKYIYIGDIILVGYVGCVGCVPTGSGPYKGGAVQFSLELCYNSYRISIISIGKLICLTC